MEIGVEYFILKELLQVGEVDYVTRAPRGKEVEDLTKDEVMVALRDKIPVEQIYHDVGVKVEKVEPKGPIKTPF